MHVQKTVIIIAAVLGAIFVFSKWATLPLLGTVTGINNGAGMFSLLCFGIILVLSLSGDRSTTLQSNMRLIFGVLGVCIAVACIYYISTIKDANEKMVQASNASVFGVSVGPVFKEGTFNIEPGVYFTCSLAVAIIILAFAFTSKAEVVEIEN